MYFSEKKGCYVPDKSETILTFCDNLITKFTSDYRDTGLVEAIYGEYNGIEIEVDKFSTVRSLADAWMSKAVIEDATESEPLSNETATMVKIQDVLIASGLEYWTYYDPEKHTHIIKFGKDLEIDE